jgi:hypothetical protein
MLEQSGGGGKVIRVFADMIEKRHTTKKRARGDTPRTLDFLW